MKEEKFDFNSSGGVFEAQGVKITIPENSSENNTLIVQNVNVTNCNEYPMFNPLKEEPINVSTKDVLVLVNRLLNSKEDLSEDVKSAINNWEVS